MRISENKELNTTIQLNLELSQRNTLGMQGKKLQAEKFYLKIFQKVGKKAN